MSARPLSEKKALALFSPLFLLFFQLIKERERWTQKGLLGGDTKMGEREGEKEKRESRSGVGKSSAAREARRGFGVKALSRRSPARRSLWDPEGAGRP